MRLVSLLFAVLLTLTLPIATGAQDDDEGSQLYTVDLESGEAESVGTIGEGEAVNGLAAFTGDDGTVALYVVTDDELIAVSPEDPSEIVDQIDLSGLEDDESLVGIDVRPATNELVALSDAGRVYVVDLGDGTATAVAEDVTLDPELEDPTLGFDFNPTVDRIRVDVSTGQNLRLNPDTGQVGVNPDTDEPTIDGELAYAEDDDNDGTEPSVVGAAYTNSVADAEETVLYVVDAATGSLAIQDPPNDGTLNTVGELGIDVSSQTGFDITPDGVAYLAVSPDGDGGTPETDGGAEDEDDEESTPDA